MNIHGIIRSICCILVVFMAAGCEWSNEKDTEVMLEKIANPVFSINEGSYDRDISVTLSCSTQGAIIYYSIDGSNPTSASLCYNGPVPISGNGTMLTILAVAKKESLNGLLSSEVVMATYTIDYEKVATPVFEVENYRSSNIYDEPQQVTVSTETEGATIVYTLDGTNPKTSSTAVIGTTVNVLHTLKLKAYACKNMMSDSDVRETTYTINEAPEKPGNVVLRDITTTSVKVGWDKSIDNDGNVRDYHLYFKETGGEYEEKYYNSIYYNNNRIEVIIKNLKNNTTYSVVVTAEDNRYIESAYSNEVTFSTLDLGIISDMTAGSDPACIYALDQDKHFLYILNTQEERVVNQVLLPDAEPYRIQFSDIDNKLYITSSSSGKITVYDISTASLLQYTYSDTEFGYNIALLPLLRRIYLFKAGDLSSKIIILNMDNGDIIKRAELNGAMIGINYNEEIFSTIYEGGERIITKYSLFNDSIAVLQTSTLQSSGNHFVMSPDGERIISYNKNSSSRYNNIWDYDVDNPQNIVGVWEACFKIGQATFSYDQSLLLTLIAYSYDEYGVCIMDAATYREIVRFDVLPQIVLPQNEPILAINSDSSVVVMAINSHEQCFRYFNLISYK